MKRTIQISTDVAEHSELCALRLYHALRKPFAIYGQDENRLIALLGVGTTLDHRNFGEYSLAGVEAMEPHIPWQASFLEIRSACYRALRDLKEFANYQPLPMNSMPSVSPDPSPRLSQATTPSTK